MKWIFLVILTLFTKLSLAKPIDNEVENTTSNLDIKGDLLIFGGHNKTKFENENRTGNYSGIEGSLSAKHYFKVEKENDFKYGASFEVKMNSNDKSNPFYFNELTFFISDKNEGVRIFGFQPSITSKIRIDSTIFSPIANGVNGLWQRFLTTPDRTFITRQGMWVETGFASNYFLQASQNEIAIQPLESWGSSNLSLTYISSRTNGWRFGVSYAPNNKTNLLLEKKNLIDLNGVNVFDFDLNANERSYLKNIISTGINFYDAFGNFEVAFSAGFETATSDFNKKLVAEPKNFEKRNLNSYSLGLNLSYLGISFGGNFTGFGKSLYLKNIKVLGNNSFRDKDGELKDAGKSYVFDLGLGYAIDKYSTSFSYLQSKYVNNRFSAGVFSFETKATSNLSNYLQIARYQFKNAELDLPKDDQKIKGWIVTVGIKYSF